MAIFDFRILLESTEGRTFSYISSSFVNTDNDLVLSSSQVYNRITGSVSCSYQNKNIFTGDILPTTSASRGFTDNTLLSASLSGSLESGSIMFSEPENLDYDRLLRYKFVGSEKVCNVLGLPSNTWVYVDQFRLPADDEPNYIEGNLNANNIYVQDSITFANTSTFNSDLPILIDTSSDRYIKFVDTRNISENALLIGYDVDEDVYEISASDDKTFNILGVDKITSKTSTGGTSAITGEIHLNTGEFGSSLKVGNPEVRISSGDVHIPNGNYIYLTGSGNVTTDARTSIGFTPGELTFRANSDNNNETLVMSGGRVGINNVDEPEYTLDVDGDIRATGTGSFGRIETTIVSSSIVYSSGSNIFGDASIDTHIFNGNISASGNITANLFRVNNYDFVQVVSSPERISIGNTNTEVNIIGDGAGYLHISESNIGIGTIEPTKKLQVLGDISASGFVYGDRLYLEDLRLSKHSGGGLDLGVNSINAVHHITASGNISSSATVYADSGSFNYLNAPGAIIGYTAIGIDATADSKSVGAVYALTDADHKVQFIAPTSGKVEIEISISVISTSTRELVLFLADTILGSPIDFPNANDVTNIHSVGDILVTDLPYPLNHKWVVEGLVAGDAYLWHLGCRAEQAGRITLHWGGDATDEYAPFIMKATALPSNMYTG